ncbi:MAG TPA: chromate transporter [Pseudolysinimonas sp.]|jgi:chromate transporter|nr:chromate transporter [Pseudolysinimonas sp.]
MSLGLLYLLLLKATVTSFSGMGSLPQIRQDFVVTRRVVDDEQLSRAVLVGRSTPGPLGAFVVSIGYAARGWPGAVAGWLAVVTPAFLAVPLLVLLRRWLYLSRLRTAVDAVIIAGATLLVPSGVGLARDAIAQLFQGG